MNIYEFVDMYKEARPENTFFDDGWLNLLGESFDRMTVLDQLAPIFDKYDGKVHMCYLIYSKVEGWDGIRDVIHAFDVDTLESIPFCDWIPER